MSDGEATLKTKHGEFTIRVPYWSSYTELEDEHGQEVNIYSPEHDDPDSYAIQLKVGGNWLETEEEADSYQRLISAAADIAAMLRWAWEDELENAEQRRREEEEAAQKAEETRKQVIAERRDRLMMEFVGETVKVRERYYKTARVAKIDVREARWKGEDEYELRFNYTGQDWRTQNVERIQRLDIKIGARWKTLWDDGTDDIGGDWALASSAKPTGEMYDSMNTED